MVVSGVFEIYASAVKTLDFERYPDESQFIVDKPKVT